MNLSAGNSHSLLTSSHLGKPGKLKVPRSEPPLVSSWLKAGVRSEELMISAIKEVVGIGIPGALTHETFCGRSVKLVAPMLAGTGAAIIDTHSNRIETRDRLGCGRESTLSSCRVVEVVGWFERLGRRSVGSYIVIQLHDFRRSPLAPWHLTGMACSARTRKDVHHRIYGRVYYGDVTPVAAWPRVIGFISAQGSLKTPWKKFQEHKPP